MTINKAIKVLQKIPISCDQCFYYRQVTNCKIHKGGKCTVGEAIDMAIMVLKKEKQNELV